MTQMHAKCQPLVPLQVESHLTSQLQPVFHADGVAASFCSVLPPAAAPLLPRTALPKTLPCASLRGCFPGNLTYGGSVYGRSRPKDTNWR